MGPIAVHIFSAAVICLTSFHQQHVLPAQLAASLCDWISAPAVLYQLAGWVRVRVPVPAVLHAMQQLELCCEPHKGTLIESYRNAKVSRADLP
jgi:hypothetical protein